MPTRRAYRSLIVVVAIVACSRGLTPADSNPRCPPATGEFPARACAIVRARAVDREGRPIASLGIRVDSYVREQGYAYASDGTRTGADGRFELTVLRINEFQPPSTPDTATVELKATPGVVPVPGFSATARAPVRMRFAPMGSPIEPTLPGDVVFALP